MKSVFENVYNSIFSMDFFSPTKFDNKLLTNNFEIRTQFEKDLGHHTTYYGEALQSGIISAIKTTILNSIKEIENIEFIDLRKNKFDINQFIYKIERHDKMLVSYDILLEVQRQNNFLSYYNTKTYNSISPLGNLSGVDVWCESNPEFQNVIITTYKPLNMSLDIKFDDYGDPKFDTIVINMNIDKNIEFKIWYLIESENDKNWYKFVQWNRDKKIKILTD
jgi:hypothetical protein